MIRILFTGYAPVHFVCFRPLYSLLARAPGVSVTLSGGLRGRGSSGKTVYDERGLYDRFELPAGAVRSVEEIRAESYDILFCANTKRIEPGAYGRSIEIFHGLSFRNRAVRSANGTNDHYFVLGPYMHRLLVSSGVLRPRDPRVVPVGFMKTDCLLDGSIRREDVLARYRLDGERPVVLYAPTGARRNSLETMGAPLLGALTRAGRFDVIVKPHDHPKDGIDWAARLAPLESERIRVAREPDVAPLLVAADVLLTDASSVANEYALLDRPIVFADVPELLRAARAKPESNLDLRTWGRRAGRIGRDPGSIVAALDEAVAHPLRRSSVRRRLVSDLFYNPGFATATAATWLRDALGVAVDPPYEHAA